MPLSSSYDPDEYDYWPEAGPAPSGATEGAPTPPPATHPVEERDQPDPSATVEDDERVAEVEQDEHPEPLPERHRVVLPQPIPTRPGAGRIVTAQTVNVTATDGTGQLLGLDPSRVQAQTIVGCIITIEPGDADVMIAGDPHALPSMRARVWGLGAGAERSVWLPGVPGVYAWSSAPVGASAVVLGV